MIPAEQVPALEFRLLAGVCQHRNYFFVDGKFDAPTSEQCVVSKVLCCARTFFTDAARAHLAHEIVCSDMDGLKASRSPNVQKFLSWLARQSEVPIEEAAKIAVQMLAKENKGALPKEHEQAEPLAA